VTLAGGLLGPCRKRVAVTVMLGSMFVPMLRRAGYPKDTAGPAVGGGIAHPRPAGDGAAAFLIAEFLKISYVQVIAMAVLPALLYYLSVFLMVEADSRRLGTRRSRTPSPRLPS